MEKELTNLFIEKRYQELSDDERGQVNEFCTSEEEFEQMCHVFMGVELLKNEKFHAKKETKEALDGLFTAVHAPQQKVIWLKAAWLLIYPEDKAFVRKPLIQMAAVALVLLLTVPFLNREKLVDQPAFTSKVEKTKDLNTVKTTDAVTSPDESEPGITSRTESKMPLSSIETTTTVVDATVYRRADQAAAEMYGASIAGAEFEHPDGQFTGVEAAFSYPASKQTGVFDLITAAF